MSGSSSSQTPVTTTQTSDPWAGAQPHLMNTMADAQAFYNAGVGYQPYTDTTLAEPHPTFSQGWNNAYGIAAGEPYGSSGVNAARSLAEMMQNQQGLSAGQSDYAIPQLKNSVSQFQNLYDTAQGQQNPYLLAQIAANDRRIGDKVNSSMSGAGRYGSGAHTDVLSRSLAEAANPILAQDYSQRQQQALAAAGGGAQTAGAISDIYGSGLQRAGQFAQLMPTLDEARYASSDRLMGLGDYYTQRGQTDLNAQIQAYNAQQALPWEQLQRYNAITSGAGALGGSKVTTTPSVAPPLSNRIMGGAVAGAGLGSMFGAPGAGVGALGGGLLGMM